MSNQGSIHERAGGARKPGGARARRAAFGRRALLLMAAALLAAGGAQAAQTRKPSAFSETYGDWRVNCGGVPEKGARQCAMEQQLHVRDDKTGRSHRLMIVTLAAPKKDGAAELSALTPFGLLLASGAKLRIDGGEPLGPLPFWTCLRRGCVLRGPLDPAKMALLRKGKKVKLEMTTTARKSFDVTISLKGFTDAFARLKNAAAR